jgi:hypothetical protein
MVMVPDFAPKLVGRKRITTSIESPGAGALVAAAPADDQLVAHKWSRRQTAGAGLEVVEFDRLDQFAGVASAQSEAAEKNAAAS